MTEWGIRLPEISIKDGPARSQEVGRDGAGPGTGQQPLPGFLTALLFEAGSWTSRKWATSLPTKERKLLECFSSTSCTGPGAGGGSPAKGCLTPQLSQDAQPPPSCRAGSLRSLLIQIQTLQAPTSRPACLRRHPQSSTNAPESCWTGHLPPHPLRDRSLCL